ncbi:DUF1343 domain-containing protein [Phycisphaeraceae bacterium D3-23]
MKRESILRISPILLLTALFFLAGCHTGPAARPPVLTGLDQYAAEDFDEFHGSRVGLIVNHSALTRRGEHILDLMHANPDVEVAAVFAPEHGIRGTADERVADGIDEATGIRVYSLYGELRQPTQAMLEGLDVLVFDIQDIGARFYTYIATMGLCMQAAAEKGIPFIVLDRPNPLGGHAFDGPIQDPDNNGSFVSFRPMPITHGMTVGEVAHYYNEGGDSFEPIGCQLYVRQIAGWERGTLYDQTGLPWVNPSPNMRSLDEEILYTMVALTEGNKDVSVGRGTDRPFEYLGAPWIDGAALTAELRSRGLPGLWVMQTTFIPSGTDITGRTNYPYQFIDEVCEGVRFVVTDRDAFEPVVAGVHMLDALLRLYPERYSVDKLGRLVGAQWVLDALKAGETPDAIVARWRASEAFKTFERERAAVLLYE